MIPQDIIDKLNLYYDPIADAMRMPNEKYYIVLSETDQDNYLSIFLRGGKAAYIQWKMDIEWIRDFHFSMQCLTIKSKS